MGSLPNMMRSLLVIVAIVIGFVALVPRADRLDTPQIDVLEVAAARGAESGLPLAGADPVPSGWRQVSAYFTRTADGAMTWQANYETASRAPLAIKQAVSPGPAWYDVATARGERVGHVSIAARQWDEYYSADKKQVTFVRAPGPGETLTTVVTGQAGRDEVIALASALVVPTPTGAATGA
jgi:hypothetical protein